MGMELTAIAISTEEEFQIRIDDDDLPDLKTVGDLHAYVVARVPQRRPIRDTACPNVRAFCEIRRALTDLASTPRAAVRPSVALKDVLPRKGRRARWDELERRLDLSLPSLEHPRWYSRALVASTLLATAVGVAWLVHRGEPEYALALAVMTPIVVLATYVLGLNVAPELAVVIPEGATVRGLTQRRAARIEMRQIQSDPPTAHSREIFARLQLLIAEELGLPREQVTPEARFIEDLCGD